MNQPPFNDGMFGMGKGIVNSTSWRKWFSDVSGLPILKSKPLLANLVLGALEFYDDGTTGHLYITQNVGGVLTRVLIV